MFDLGIEYNPKYTRFLDESNKISHVQVSVPSDLDLIDLEDLIRRKPVVLHTNIFSPLAEISLHDWAMIDRFAEIINQYDFSYNIEHFTNFRTSNNSKQAVYFNANERGIESRSIENVCKWQDKVKMDLYLENVPVTRYVMEYFSLLGKVQKETGCKLTIDVSHLLISAASLKGDALENFSMLCDKVKTESLHICGISLKEGKIDDAHNAWYGWEQNLIHYFKNVKTITLENSSTIPIKTIDIILNFIEKSSFPSAFNIKIDSVATQEETNLRLAESQKNNLIPELSTESRGWKLQSIDMTSKYFRYVKSLYPFLEISQEFFESIGMQSHKGIITSLVRLTKKINLFNQWFEKGKSELVLSIEANGGIKNFKVGEDSHEALHWVEDMSELICYATNNGERISLNIII